MLRVPASAGADHVLCVQARPGRPSPTLHLFAVHHGVPRAELGDFILRRRPASVVLETAVNEEHGSATGNVLSLAMMGQDGLLRGVMGAAREVQMEAEIGSPQDWVRSLLSEMEVGQCK